LIPPFDENIARRPGALEGSISPARRNWTSDSYVGGLLEAIEAGDVERFLSETNASEV
jgi:hypothetical protein